MLKTTKILGCLGFLGSIVLLVACQPRIATSFWKIGTEADSLRAGYTVIHAEGKTRHCYPITEWIADPSIDTYHQLHHHGVAVESELMAYRIYFDKKQTIDPYCKRKPQLELAQSHWYPNDSLLAEGYGDDILRVSGTVGVGSVKYWQITNHQLPITNGKLCHIDKVASRSQRIVSQKKNEATIEVAVKGWEIPKSPITNHQSQIVDIAAQYTLCAGHRDMRCDVLLSDTLSGLCTGVQTIPAKGTNLQSSIFNLQLENGVLLASWGTDWPVNDSAKFAKETVGLAVFIPKQFAGDIVQDKQNLLCLLKQSPITNHQSPMCATAHFYLTVCGATKENHPVATSAEEWFAYLRRWAKNLK